MSKQEIKIITKIIRELSLFLMMHGFKDFGIQTKNTPDTTSFIITMDHPKESFINHMREKLEREREMEVETYGWELIGDIDGKTELEILGLLIDSMDVVKEEDKTIITLVRKNRYLD